MGDSSSRLYRWRGSTWSDGGVQTGGGNMSDIHFASPTNGYAVTTAPRAYHFDGGTWTDARTPTR